MQDLKLLLQNLQSLHGKEFILWWRDVTKLRDDEFEKWYHKLPEDLIDKVFFYCRQWVDLITGHESKNYELPCQNCKLNGTDSNMIIDPDLTLTPKKIWLPTIRYKDENVWEKTCDYKILPYQTRWRCPECGTKS